MKRRRQRSRDWFGRVVAATAILAGGLMWAWSCDGADLEMRQEEMSKIRSTLVSGVAASLAVGLAAGLAASAWASAAVTVIKLTQAACQFVESENGMDRGLTTTKAADRIRINRATGAKRRAQAKPLILKPGRYEFRVTNKNVSYELGFFCASATSIFSIPCIS